MPAFPVASVGKLYFCVEKYVLIRGFSLYACFLYAGFPVYIYIGTCSGIRKHVLIRGFLAANEQLYNSLCLSVGRSVGQTFSHDDVNRIEAKPLKVESSDLECSLI